MSRSRGGGAAGQRRGGGGHVGDEEFVGADLDHRFLIVQGRHARAGQHAHVALGLEQLQHAGEITVLHDGAEYATDALRASEGIALQPEGDVGVAEAAQLRAS
ncbi:hypothetical protein SSTU70S_04907 [Stutzerimonas stutzeri]